LFGHRREIALCDETLEARSGYLKKRKVNHPKFSISILAPSRKFSGPCSINTTQQNVAIAKHANQNTQRKYHTCRSYASTFNVQPLAFPGSHDGGGAEQFRGSEEANQLEPRISSGTPSLTAPVNGERSIAGNKNLLFRGPDTKMSL
jgi:hypothetical protein